MYLIEEKVKVRPVGVLRVEAKIGVQETLEILWTHGRKTIVLKVDVEHLGFIDTLIQEGLHALIQRPGLAAAAHADEDVSFADALGHGGERRLPGTGLRQRGGVEVDYEPLEDLTHLFLITRNIIHVFILISRNILGDRHYVVEERRFLTSERLRTVSVM